MAIVITIVMSICIIVIVIINISIITIINPTSYKCNECYLCSGVRRADLYVHRGGARGHILWWGWGGSDHPEEGHHLRECVHPRQVSYEANVRYYWYLFYKYLQLMITHVNTVIVLQPHTIHPCWWTSVRVDRDCLPSSLCDELQSISRPLRCTWRRRTPTSQWCPVSVCHLQ